MILASFEPDKYAANERTDTATADKKINSRSQARILAMQYVYQNQINAMPVAAWLSQSVQKSVKHHADIQFARQLIDVCLNTADLDAHYQPYITKGSYHLGEVEKAILRIATAELMYMQDTANAVIINEAVNMSKAYGGLDSYKLVNAVLDSLLRNQQPSDSSTSAADE